MNDSSNISETIPSCPSFLSQENVPLFLVVLCSTGSCLCIAAMLQVIFCKDARATFGRLMLTELIAELVVLLLHALWAAPVTYWNLPIIPYVDYTCGLLVYIAGFTQIACIHCMTANRFIAVRHSICYFKEEHSRRNMVNMVVISSYVVVNVFPLLFIEGCEPYFNRHTWTFREKAEVCFQNHNTFSVTYLLGFMMVLSILLDALIFIKLRQGNEQYFEKPVAGKLRISLRSTNSAFANKIHCKFFQMAVSLTCLRLVVMAAFMGASQLQLATGNYFLVTLMWLVYINIEIMIKLVTNRGR